MSYDKPLFITKNNRPIYGAPAWQVHPQGGYIVVFATGILLEDADLADTTQRESIYGIWDPTSLTGQETSAFATVPLNALLEQTVSKLEATIGTESYYSLSDKIIDWTAHRGWTLTLGHTHAGERSFDQIRNLGSSVIINTTVLNGSTSDGSENCAPGNLPPNYLYALNAVDGAGKPAFDITRDGLPDAPALAYSESGGLSRGIAFFPPPPPGTISVVGEMSPVNGIGVQNEAGEGHPDKSGCMVASTGIAGASNSTFAVYVDCPVEDPEGSDSTPKPWSRQQYQLTRPPL